MGRAVILFLDSNIVIYRFEGTHALQLLAAGAVDALVQRHPQASLAVSRLTRMECLTKPLAEQDDALLARYDAFFAQVRMVELDAGVIDQATRLRALHRLKTPDALVAACALSLPAPTLFITADAGFRRVPDLAVEWVGAAR